MPKALSSASCQGSLADVQQSHSPRHRYQTESLTRCPNYGSQTKASPRNVSFCSLLLAPKFSRHIQTLKAIQLLPNMEQLLWFSNGQNGVIPQKENLFPYTGSTSAEELYFPGRSADQIPFCTSSKQTKQNAEATAAITADNI